MLVTLLGPPRLRSPVAIKYSCGMALRKRYAIGLLFDLLDILFGPPRLPSPVAIKCSNFWVSAPVRPVPRKSPRLDGKPNRFCPPTYSLESDMTILPKNGLTGSRHGRAFCDGRPSCRSAAFPACLPPHWKWAGFAVAASVVPWVIFIAENRQKK